MAQTTTCTGPSLVNVSVASLLKNFKDCSFFIFRSAVPGDSGARQLSTWQDFRLFLLLSDNRSDAIKRAQLDHLCTHTLKGPS